MKNQQIDGGETDMKKTTNKVTKFSDKTNGLLNYADLKKPQFRILYGVMLAILIGFRLICLLPLV